MKKTIITLMLAGAMMILTIPAAVANSANSKSTAGAETTDCRPGADNDLIGGWEPMSKSEYVDDIYTTFEIDPTDPENEDLVKRINESADGTWAFCDKNLDGTLCVLKTDPSPYYYTLLDNRPFQTGRR